MKGKEKLTGVNKLLVDWITKFDKDNEKEFKEKGIEVVITGKSKNSIEISITENEEITWNSVQYFTMLGYSFKSAFTSNKGQVVLLASYDNYKDINKVAEFKVLGGS